MNGDEVPPPPPPPASTPPIPEWTTAIECSLCGNAVTPTNNRCTQCGLYQQLGAHHPNPFVNRARLTLILAGIAVYLVVLAIVAVLPAAK